MKTDSKLKEKMSKKSLIIIGILAALFLISMAANLVLGYFLLAPNNDKQKVEAVKQELSDKDKQIKSLQDSISKLKGDVVEAKDKAADAKLENAETKEKAAKEKQAQAEREKAEADKKKAEEADKQKTAAANQGNGNTADIKKKVDHVILLLTKASKENEGQKKKELRASATKELRTLAQLDPKHKSTYDDVATKLTSSYAKLNGDPKNHYKILIQELNKIK